MTFNGNAVTPAATYLDTKGFGMSDDYEQGLFVYDVTSQFLKTGNSMTITPQAENKNGIYGAYLVVVYEDPSTSLKKIWINDECDILASANSYSVTSDEELRMLTLPVWTPAMLPAHTPSLSSRARLTVERANSFSTAMNTLVSGAPRAPHK